MAYRQAKVQIYNITNEGNVDFNGLAHPRIREVLFHAFAIPFVRQLLADLGEIVLTIGIVEVGQQFGALVHQMTALTPEIPGRPHLRGVEVGLGQYPAAQ
jgi:hypothetical protein